MFQAIILCNLKENEWNELEKLTKPNFGPDFGSFWPRFGPQEFLVGFTSTIYIVASYHCVWFQGMAKNLVSSPFLGGLAQIRAAKFFFIASSVARYYGQLSSCAISEKTNDPILKKLSGNERTDLVANRQMDRRIRVIS